MRQGQKHIAILGLAAAIAGASVGPRARVQDRPRGYYDPAGRSGGVPNKSCRGKRRRATRGRK